MDFVHRSFDAKGARGFVYALSGGNRYVTRAMMARALSVWLSAANTDLQPPNRPATGFWKRSFNPTIRFADPKIGITDGAFDRSQAMFQLLGATIGTVSFRRCSTF